MSDFDLTNEQRCQIELLAEEYVGLHRSGKAPSIDQFVRDYPDLEDDIRELFPVMLMLDRGKSPAVSSFTADADLAFAPEIAPGAQLGDYHLEHVIGRGGMGLVYRAKHVQLGSKVAIKLLPSSLNRPKLQERFLREASAAARMNHPNIVRVFDYGRQGMTHYYVMSLVEGFGLDRLLSGVHHQKKKEPGVVAPTILSHYRSLIDSRSHPAKTQNSVVSPSSSQSLPTKAVAAGTTSQDASTVWAAESRGLESTIAGASNSSLSDASRSANSIWEWVATVGVQAADALSYAHEMGVIHRDIKPSNLMMDFDGKLFVTDFGLAKLQDDSSLTETGDLLGTLRYLPPEALHGGADEQGDIYGLGLTLYELLAGEPAFTNVERAKLFHDIASGDVVPIHRKVPKIPRDLAQIIRKAIEPDPSLRYASSAALRDDLHRFLSGEPILARPASIFYRMQRWVSRNIAITALAALIFILLAVAATTATVTADRFRDLAQQKANESSAAVTARKNSVAQARAATLSLLRSHLSEARASASVAAPGRAISGTAALRNAIDLSRKLRVFDQHHDEINSIAIALATKYDIQSEFKWRNEQSVGRYDCFDFNGSLSEYAYVTHDKTTAVCKVVSVQSGRPETIDSFEIDGNPDGETFSLSDDGRILSAFIRQRVNNKDVMRPWIYDRKFKRTIYPGVPSRPRSFAESIPLFHHSPRVAFLADDQRVVVYDAELQKQLRRTESLEFPADHLVISPDDRYAALFQEGSSNIAILDLSTAEIQTLSLGRDGADITEVAWRPDGQQLALATKGEIRIWDIGFDRCIQWFPHDEDYITELHYLCDGRVLAASGWEHVTQFYDPIAQKRIFRCESFLATASADGQKVVFHGDDRLELLRMHSPTIVNQFALGATSRLPKCGIHTASGTLWVGMKEKFSIVDFIGNRCAFSQNQFASLATDPLGRDTFVSTRGSVYRLPCNVVDRNKASNGFSKDKSFRFGPKELILSRSRKSNAVPKLVTVSANGEKLGVNSETSKCEIELSRSMDWRQASHNHAEQQPIRVNCHPTKPLIATSSHHGRNVEVRNTETGEVVLLLPGQMIDTGFSPDGSKLVVAGLGMIRVYDTIGWKLINRTADEIQYARYFAISSDSRWLQVETLDPRGLAILDLETLKPALFFPGEPLDPQSMPGCFDPSGRFMAADRGKSTISVWDLHKLKQFFQSLDLEWPLPGLGNPTPLRDRDGKVEVIWDSAPVAKPKQKAPRFEIDRLVKKWLRYRLIFLEPSADLIANSEIEWVRTLGFVLRRQIDSLETKWLTQ